MPARNIHIETLHLSDGRVLKMGVEYDIGGWGVFGEGQRPRGYRLTANLLRVVPRGEAQAHIYEPGSFATSFVEAAPRYNARRLEQLSHSVRSLDAYPRLRDLMLSRFRVTIAPHPNTPAAAASAAPADAEQLAAQPV